MKKLHVTELTDEELTAVFQAAAKDAVKRAHADGKQAPSLSWPAEHKAASKKKTAAPGIARKKAVA